MEHLIQRQSGYYFRLIVPPDLKPIFRKNEIKRSLKTGSLSLAKERAFLLSGRLKKLFRQMRYSDDMKLEKHHIDGLIRKYVRETLDQDEEERILNDRAFDPEFHKDHTEILGLAKDLIRTKHAQRDNDFISESVDQLLEAEGFTPLPNKKSYEYRKLCHEMYKADAYIWETKRKREQGDYSNDKVDYHPGQEVPGGSQVIPQQEPDKPPSGPSLKTLVDQWFQESTKADLWSIRTHQRYAGNFRIILQILGEDLSIDSVDHVTVRDLKDTLFKLPAGMNKKPAFQDKMIPEIIELNEKEIHAETLSVSTINSYLTVLGAFFKWCVGNGYIHAPKFCRRIQNQDQQEQKET